MTELRVLCFVAVTALACFSGCAGTSAAAVTSTLPVRVLSSEAPSAPRPEPVSAPSRDATPSAATPSDGATLPRIGAPGGSGAGSRRVTPAQSGNETVGGLPAGTAGPTGAAGLG